MKSLRFAIFVHDLSSNPIGRMHPIILALERLGHLVEVIGLTIRTSDIYAPYRKKHRYTHFQSNGTLSDALKHAPRLASLADTAEVIYAAKPFATSFLPALLASGMGRKKPLFVDIEDVWAPPGSDSLAGKFQHYIRGFRSATSAKYGVALHPLLGCASGVTVSTKTLQKRYGGHIVRHGPDESQFDPDLPECQPPFARAKFHIPLSAKVIGFAGTPHPHKGLSHIVKSLSITRHDFHLLLCGDRDHPLFKEAKQRLGNRCTLTGFLPNAEMPAFLAACDIVPVLQQNNRYAQAQLPAKLLEALAMGKIVIGSSVGDLPELLGHHSSTPWGWLAESNDPACIAHCLDEIADLPDSKRKQLAALARSYFLQNASVATNTEKFRTILTPLE
jgi:glycosyltransferase involved in cell wall biosynthesis